MRARIATCFGTLIFLVTAWLPAAAQSGSEPLTTSSAELAQLQSASVSPSDLAPEFRVELYPGGTEVAGRVSLDLCGGDYASEHLRTGRLQVAVVPVSASEAGVELASVEAIGYRDDTAARQAMSELRTAALNCPRSSFVPSGVQGIRPTNWQFNRAPDGTWQKQPGIQRLAFDVTLTDQHGRSAREHLIYLRHGPFIVGIYGRSDELNLIAAPRLKGEAGLVQTIGRRMSAVRSLMAEI
jgi:hypothetical protein